MAKSDDDDRVTELKRRLAQISGGKMVAWESDALPPELREKFWRRIADFEQAERTTLFQQLLDAGIELPEPESLDFPDFDMPPHRDPRYDRDSHLPQPGH